MVDVEKVYEVGESFRVQFVLQVPEGDYLRAVFTAEVLGHETGSDKYLARLTAFVAGRQESAVGEKRPATAVSREYWSLVDSLVGRKALLAYETADGRSLPLRLATLTGEHNFFSRFEGE
jgi:hypothetical protein